MSKETSAAAFIITMLIYLINIAFLIALKVYVMNKAQPNITKLNYVKDETFWDRTNLRYSPPQFCRAGASVKTPMELDTDDYAVLLTLPRLYSVNSDGNCYIKPKLRGVFDSTMKYVFGEDYEEQGITIMCYPKTHYPYIVITSKKFDSVFTEGEDASKYTALQDENPQFKAESTDYFGFKNNPIDTDKLCSDGKAKDSCEKLKKCITDNGGTITNCGTEKEAYTNDYWATFSNDYVELKGFEQYQYTIKDDMKIQPKFVSENKTLVSGLHIVAGASFEDIWGYGYLFENIFRVYIPNIFEQFIPLAGAVTNFLNNVYSVLSEYLYGFLYVQTFSFKEMTGFSDLMSRFNFTHDSVFTIGHSISGTTIKEFSYVSNFSGIAFEASKGLNYAGFRLSEKYKKIEDHTNHLANIYGTTLVLSGADADFSMNGKLPSLFFNPNSFDNACLTAATCSNTRKYIPFCKQVLNQGGADPEKEFNKILEAFYKAYD